MFIPPNLTGTDGIQKELEEMQLFLESPYAADQGNEVQARFDSLGIYMARSGKLKADAEFHFNQVVESSIFDLLKKSMEEKLSPSTLNKLVDAAARNYKFLLTWSDRVNRSLTHQYDGMRSVISNLRAERQAFGYGR